MITITTLIVFAVGAVVGTVASYLFFRANPNKKAAVDEFVDKTKEDLKNLE